MTTYTPEWARTDNPTQTMTHAEMTAYYKAHSLAGDAMFALRPGTETPQVILNGWNNLLNDLDKRKGKATPALRAEGKRLRTLTRAWLMTQPRLAVFVTRDDESEAA
jgi:hypothetical protein